MEMALLSGVFINISLKYISKICFALETRRIFHIFYPLWRQQSKSQILNWWRSKWTNLAVNQSGLRSLFNKRGGNKITKKEKKKQAPSKNLQGQEQWICIFHSFFYCWQYYRCLPFPPFCPYFQSIYISSSHPHGSTLLCSEDSPIYL